MEKLVIQSEKIDKQSKKGTTERDGSLRNGFYLHFELNSQMHIGLKKSKSDFTLSSWKMSDMKYLNRRTQYSTLGYKTLIL